MSGILRAALSAPPALSERQIIRKVGNEEEDQISVLDLLREAADLPVVAPLCRGASGTATERRWLHLHLVPEDFERVTEKTIRNAGNEENVVLGLD
jgi:hypothetical protein